MREGGGGEKEKKKKEYCIYKHCTHGWFIQFIIQSSSSNNDSIQLIVYEAYAITLQPMLAIVNLLRA